MGIQKLETSVTPRLKRRSSPQHVPGFAISNLYDVAPAKTQTPNTPLPKPPLRMHRSERIPKDRDRVEEAEEITNDLFLPPPSTAPAALPVSRAGRRSAHIMKALDV